MIKKRLSGVILVTLVSLTAACAAVGGNSASDVKSNSTDAAPRQDSREVEAERGPVTARLGKIFRGTIADAKVELDIKRDAGTLSGNYFYLRSGSSSRLTLNGKIGPDGSFTLDESDANGKATGHFSGKWKE